MASGRSGGKTLVPQASRPQLRLARVVVATAAAAVASFATPLSYIPLAVWGGGGVEGGGGEGAASGVSVWGCELTSQSSEHSGNLLIACRV